MGPNGQAAFATSLHHSEQEIEHAERRALKLYKYQFGEISSGFCAVTTLSPCTAHIPTRMKGPCAELLASNGIKRVHWGIADTREKDCIQRFKDLGLTCTTTSDASMSRVCEALSELIYNSGSRYTDNLIGLKTDSEQRVFGSWNSV